MNFILENLLIAVITIIAWLVIPPFLMRFTPLGKIFQHRKTHCLTSLKAVTRPKAIEVTLSKQWWPHVCNGLLFTFFIFVFPLLVGKFLSPTILHLLHPGALAVFPLQGEFILMIVAFILGVVLAVVLSYSLFSLIPTVGVTMAARNVYNRLTQFKELERTRDKQELWWQLNQLAGKYDLMTWYRTERNKFAWALLLMVCLSTPFLVWINLTNARVTDQEIVVKELLGSQRRYTWDQVEEIELSIEGISGRTTRQAPTFTFTFTDGSQVQVWGDAFAVIHNDLLATCDAAKAHQMEPYISPLMSGRLGYFNAHFQSRIQTVVDRCSTPLFDIEPLF